MHNWSIFWNGSCRIRLRCRSARSLESLFCGRLSKTFPGRVFLSLSPFPNGLMDKGREVCCGACNGFINWKTCNRRGEAVSGAKLKKSHCEPNLVRGGNQRMAHIHYDKSIISPSYPEHHFGPLKYDINHTLVVLLSTIGCVECSRGQKHKKKHKS